MTRNERLHRLLMDSSELLWLELDREERILAVGDSYAQINPDAASPVGKPWAELATELEGSLPMVPGRSAELAFSLDTPLGPWPFRATALRCPTPESAVEETPCWTLLASPSFAKSNQIVTELSRLHDELINLNRALLKEKQRLQRTMARLKQLEGIIPICMYCHRIRDDDNNWQQFVSYISEHSDAQFSHDICPACLEKHHPEL